MEMGDLLGLRFYVILINFNIKFKKMGQMLKREKNRHDSKKS